MVRLFVAIDLPEEVKQRLEGLCSGVPGARWVRDRQFHLTLRFVGEVDGPGFRALAEALHAVRGNPFELSLRGVGHFPPRGAPRVLWAGVDGHEAVHELHRRVERIVRRCGHPPEPRKFMPHITLARLRGAPEARVLSFLREHIALQTEPFVVDSVQLFRSTLAGEGSIHTVEDSYPLFDAHAA